MLTKRAIVEWLPQESGGRSQPPSGGWQPPYYSTVVRFLDGEPWPAAVCWSLVVRRVDAGEDPYRWAAEVHFLVEEAPHHVLVNGTAFALYEGRKCVARGRVIG